MKQSKNELKRQNKDLLESIKRKCYDCSGYSWQEVKLCVIPHCSLFPFRTGKYHTPNPIQEETSISHGENELKSEKQLTLEEDGK